MIAFRSEARAAGAVLRLSDVADLSALPAVLRARAEQIALPWRADRSAAIGSLTLASVVRAHMPMLACWLPAPPANGTTRIQPNRSQLSGPRVAPAPDPDAVQTGDTLALRIGVGAVRVERQVEVLQRAKPGQRLFVRDADGHLLSVRYADNQP